MALDASSRRENDVRAPAGDEQAAAREEGVRIARAAGVDEPFGPA